MKLVSKHIIAYLCIPGLMATGLLGCSEVQQTAGTPRPSQPASVQQAQAEPVPTPVVEPTPDPVDPVEEPKPVDPTVNSWGKRQFEFRGPIHIGNAAFENSTCLPSLQSSPLTGAHLSINIEVQELTTFSFIGYAFCGIDTPVGGATVQGIKIVNAITMQGPEGTTPFAKELNSSYNGKNFEIKDLSLSPGKYVMRIATAPADGTRDSKYANDNDNFLLQRMLMIGNKDMRITVQACKYTAPATNIMSCEYKDLPAFE